MNAHSPWFRLWQRYGVCRVEIVQKSFDISKRGNVKAVWLMINRKGLARTCRY